MQKVGDGTRALHFFIDTMVVTIGAMLLFRWRNWYVMYWGYEHYNFGWFFFSSIFGYYFIAETLFAKTLGKLFTHSKVVTLNGKKPSISIIFWRSLLRLTIIDLFFGPFLGGPLHDFASKTTVVED